MMRYTLTGHEQPTVLLGDGRIALPSRAKLPSISGPPH